MVLALKSLFRCTARNHIVELAYSQSCFFLCDCSCYTLSSVGSGREFEKSKIGKAKKTKQEDKTSQVVQRIWTDLYLFFY